MQALVAAHPEVIADRDGNLLLIKREQPIADQVEGSGRWSLDHLFVTRTGIPVLVELKRASDTRLRREVVGQMLDYAANGTAYWRAGRIAESFAESMTKLNKNADVVLAEFLGFDRSPDEFWQQVDANFAAGRVKLVFVADTIPRELARIVEFLNEQMRADVRAVELAWFESDGGLTALAPRIIGETERAQDSKAARSDRAPISRDQWVEKHILPLGQAAVAAAEEYIGLIDKAGGSAQVTSTQGSIIAVFETASGPLYPFGLVYWSKGAVQFNLKYLASNPAFASPEKRQDLYDGLVKIVGPLSTTNTNGFPTFSLQHLNDPAGRALLGQFVQELVDLARSQASAGHR
ncbi:hypothetical protein [Sphingomonas sp. URHD0057]|uniref:hypothetical protein n=1 Tax=Sphingomonas sp. URHD0057 TaxID=1380389 RepID=UPI000688F66A|nr:hypothetical protein [Sphingomonas sp. URHD0057]